MFFWLSVCGVLHLSVVIHPSRTNYLVLQVSYYCLGDSLLPFPLLLVFFDSLLLLCCFIGVLVFLLMLGGMDNGVVALQTWLFAAVFRFM